MDTLELQIYELEERIFFLENQAEHNSCYFKETLGSLTKRISNLEDQISVKDKCDQTHPSLIEKKFIKTYHPNGKCGIKLWLYVSQNQLRTAPFW